MIKMSTFTMFQSTLKRLKSIETTSVLLLLFQKESQCMKKLHLTYYGGVCVDEVKEVAEVVEELRGKKHQKR